MADRGKEETKGSGNFNTLVLSPPNKAFIFDPPLTLAELHEHGLHPKAFKPGIGIGTVLELEKDDFEGIISAVADISPGMTEDLQMWLNEMSYPYKLNLNEEDLTPPVEPPEDESENGCVWIIHPAELIKLIGPIVDDPVLTVDDCILRMYFLWRVAWADAEFSLNGNEGLLTNIFL